MISPIDTATAPVQTHSSASILTPAQSAIYGQWDPAIHTRQVAEPCPKCGSFYRKGLFCNQSTCRELAPVKESEGRIWSPKQHKYVLPKEYR